MKGYIVKGIGGFYYVKTEEGVIECKPRGIFRKQKITPVAGDEVTLETENGAAVIAEIAPRKNVFVRPLWPIWMCCSLWPAPPSPPPAHWCWTSSRPLPWTRGCSPSSSAPRLTLVRWSSCAAPMKDPLCPSLPSATTAGRAGRGQAVDQRAALRLLRQLRCRQIDPAEHPAASGRAGDQCHQPEAGARPPHHPRGDHL